MKLAILGAGKMGGAIMAGVLQAGVLQPNEIGIYDVSQIRVNELKEKFGVQVLTEKNISQAQRVLIAVKPQSFTEVTSLIARKHETYISIMAGVTIEDIAAGVASRRVIRVMPNLGASVKESATALSYLPEATKEDIQFTKELLQAVGEVYPLPEHMINAFTGLAGSGPAFAAIFAEALADGGVSVGLSRDLAKSLARQILQASAKLLEEKSPADLKDEVSSPGGTTIAGVVALEHYGLRYATIEAIKEATKRANELSQA